LKRLARDHAFSQAPSHDAAPPPHQPDIYRKPVLSPLIDTLSPQERETLSQIAEGKTNSQIGESMRLSPHTIKTYVENILRKLKVSDRTQASVAALQLGLIPESALRN
jgi:DNA-binding NarL/FixJ family response regulator